MRPLLSATLVAVLLLGAASPATAWAEGRQLNGAPSLATATPPALHCSAPEAMTRFKVTLPNTARAIRHGKALTIVAIGSSSTEGVGASDQAHTYPARLAEELRHRWPHLVVTVVNKGIGGDTAPKVLARFPRDVLPYHPQLVIWQTGTNHALTSEDVQGYEHTLREGIAQLKAAHMDVVLMDLQYAPRVLGRPLHIAIIDALSRVANDLQVGVFRRFTVMRYWVTSGQYKMEDIIARDQLHMNDTSYSCIARLLAGSLESAALATPPPQPDTPTTAGSALPARMPTSAKTTAAPPS